MTLLDLNFYYLWSYLFKWPLYANGFL